MIKIWRNGNLFTPRKWPALRFQSMNSLRYSSRKSVSSSFNRRYAAFTGLVFTTAFALSPFGLPSLHNDSKISREFEDSVSVYHTVSPFPRLLTAKDYPLSTNYTMLGYGVRSVTFMGFRIYAVGIYAATDDMALIPKVLGTSYLASLPESGNSLSDRDNIRKGFNDSAQSRIIVGDILDGGVRMLAKITPLRNTDFKHLRDGLIKSILKHPGCKENEEFIKEGIVEMKEVFKRHGSVPKDDDLLLELQKDGSLRLYHHRKDKNRTEELGSVKQPLMGRYFFSQYLSGANPLCEEVKETVSNRIISLM